MSNILQQDSIIFLAFGLAMILTGFVRQQLVKRAMLDHPNERSSHTIPVPRGGGWALLGVLIPGMVITTIFQHNLIDHAGLIAGTLILAVISWLDDRRGIAAPKRLSFHILAACLGSLAFTAQQTLFGGLLPFWFDRVIMIVGWAWFMNLYNFMDGIDGITGVETISIASGLCLAMTAAGMNDPFIEILTLLLTGSCLGFLTYNWHPAKLFLGDIGSVPLGYLTGFGLVSLAVRGHLIAALILPLYYLADTGITITKRALRGEKIWQAHRQHFYQRASLAFGRHDAVVYRIILANIALIACALLSLTRPWTGLILSFAVTGLLLWALQKTAQRTDI
jgi:UDP-N-acetylmuramyl pentapeptide phosphotransferase/UDP-N-acetylglucosamine-1-phosphate transferase